MNVARRIFKHYQRVPVRSTYTQSKFIYRIAQCRSHWKCPNMTKYTPGYKCNLPYKFALSRTSVRFMGHYFMEKVVTATGNLIGSLIAFGVCLLLFGVVVTGSSVILLYKHLTLRKNMKQMESISQCECDENENIHYDDS